MNLKKLSLTTLYFLGLFTSLFYICGEFFSATLDASGKAVSYIEEGQGFGIVQHPMLYNYNHSHNIIFHYAFLTVRLMAFRVETGFIAVTLPEKLLILGTESVGLVIFGLLILMINKKLSG